MFERVVVSITHLNSLKYRYAKGELKLNQDFVHEGILGTVFTGRLEEEIVTTRDKISAVIPTVKGSAWVTQVSEVVVDPTDPFPKVKPQDIGLLNNVIYINVFKKYDTHTRCCWKVPNYDTRHAVLSLCLYCLYISIESSLTTFTRRSNIRP